MHQLQLLDLNDYSLAPGTTLIEASAGTGKTYTLQYLVLDLLLQGLLPAEILVVTFTEAATMEMRTRLHQFLFQALQAAANPVAEGTLSPNSPDTDPTLLSVLRRAPAQAPEILRNACQRIDELTISTIHGFCQRVLSEHAFSAGYAPHREVCADLSPLLQNAVHDFCRWLHYTLPDLPQKLCSPHQFLARAHLLTSFTELATPCQQSFSAILEPYRQARTALLHHQTRIPDILTCLHNLRNRLNGRSYNPSFFERAETRLQEIFDSPDDALSNPEPRFGAEKLSQSFKKGQACTLDEPFFQDFDAFNETAKQLLPALQAKFDTWLISKLESHKNARSLLTFDDMIARLERALRLQPDLAKILRQRYRAALVDEFQDTDQRQFAIFQKLFTAEGSTDPAAQAQEHRLVMIGDPKQSIYRFRGADIQTYLAARTKASDSRTLGTNFRSEEPLVHQLNSFFHNTLLGGLQESDAAAQIAFHPVKASPKAAKRHLLIEGFPEFPRLLQRTIEHDSIKRSAKHLEQMMLGDIERLLDLGSQHKILLLSGSPEAPIQEPLCPRDCAILVSGHEDARRIQAQLRKRRIKSVLGHSGIVTQSPEARHFLVFLETCLNPRESRLNYLLASPLFGLTAHQLQHTAATERQNLHAATRQLGQQWREGTSIGIAWLRFLDQFHVSQTLLGRPDGERILTNLLHLAELARTIERREGLLPERLRDHFLNLLRGDADASGGSDDPDAAVMRLESDDDAVRIITHHASKGLEFPIVFLPDLYQRHVRIKSRKDLKAVAAPANPDRLIELVPKDKEELELQIEDNLRIGYVSLTRAVNLCLYYRLHQNPPLANANSNFGFPWFDLAIEQQQKPSHSPTKTEPANEPSTCCGEPTLFPEIDHTATSEKSSPPPAQPGTLPSRTFPRPIVNDFEITSFSHLSRQRSDASHPSEDPSERPGNEEAPDSPSPVSNSRLTASPQVTEEQPPFLPRELFPGGLNTGTCLHQILEQSDFSLKPSPALPLETLQILLDQYFPAAPAALQNARLNAILRLLPAIATASSLHGLDLASLSPSRSLRELEFHLPVQKANSDALFAILQAWSQRRGRPFPASLAHHHARSISGFLTGSIDLFLESSGAFHIIDWKTNSAPKQPSDSQRQPFDNEDLHNLMVHGNYYLQALIYSVAATQYLKSCSPANSTSHARLAGFHYVFLRGLHIPGNGWLHDSFSTSDIAAAAQALGLP